MKPTELCDLVVAGDRERLCQALAPLTEAEREELNDFAWRLFTQIEGAWPKIVFQQEQNLARYGDDVHVLVNRLRRQKYEYWRMPLWTASLAVLAVCDLDRIQKPWEHGAGGGLLADLRAMPQRMLQILDARRPEWLAKWIDADAKKEDSTVTWLVERGLIRSGLLPRNQTEGYIRRMIDTYTVLYHGPEVTTDHLLQRFDSCKELLRADPGLLEHEVWRLFEVENHAFRDSFFDIWAAALKELSANGRLDRVRLLKASLHGASLPMSPSALGGYLKFHEYLEPAVEEREKFVDEYLFLLGSSVSVVVGLALKALEVVAKAKRLPAQAFFAACEPVFRVNKKTLPAKAIQLTRLLIKQDARCHAAAAMAMTRAVSSDIPDVQEAAIETLESLKDHLGGVADALHNAFPNVAAALKPQLKRLLDGVRQSDPASFRLKADEKTGEISPLTGADLDARVSAVPASIRCQTGLDWAIQCVRDRSGPRVLPIDPRHVPRRLPSTRVAPLESIDELIDAVSALCERVDDAMEIERILDGICRFHRRPPTDFDKRVAALRKRVDKQSERGSLTVLDYGADIGLTQVVRRWLKLPRLLRELFQWQPAKESFYTLRLRELCGLLDARHEKPRRLLAMPTHDGGWIDPVILAERLQRDYVEARNPPGQYDLTQAILRLTIEGRDEAIKMLGEPNFYNGDHHLSYALGAPTAPRSSWGYSGETVGFASARARAQTEDPASFCSPHALAAAGLDADGRVALSGPVACDPALPSQLLEFVYGMEVESRREQIIGPRSWHAEWENLCYPFDHRASLMMTAARPSASRSWLAPLFDRDTVWQMEAARAAMIATSADAADARTLATDALVEAIGGMLVEPALLGSQLAAVMSLVKLNRVATVLKETAATSPLHHWAVFGMIDAFFATCDPMPADSHHLLSVALESGTIMGMTLGDQAAAKLRAINGASKTAKLANKLLRLSGDRAGMVEARTQACEAVLARAERWRDLSS